jgi:hypothetical protein
MRAPRGDFREGAKRGSIEKEQRKGRTDGNKRREHREESKGRIT